MLKKKRACFRAVLVRGGEYTGEQRARKSPCLKEGALPEETGLFDQGFTITAWQIRRQSIEKRNSRLQPTYRTEFLALSVGIVLREHEAKEFAPEQLLVQRSACHCPAQDRIPLRQDNSIISTLIIHPISNKRGYIPPPPSSSRMSTVAGFFHPSCYLLRASPSTTNSGVLAQGKCVDARITARMETCRAALQAIEQGPRREVTFRMTTVALRNSGLQVLCISVFTWAQGGGGFWERLDTVIWTPISGEKGFAVVDALLAMRRGTICKSSTYFTPSFLCNSLPQQASFLRFQLAGRLVDSLLIHLKALFSLSFILLFYTSENQERGKAHHIIMLSRNALLIFLGLMATLLQCAYAQEQAGDVALKGDQPAAGGGGNNVGRGGEAAKQDDDDDDDKADEKKNEVGTDGPNDKAQPQEEDDEVPAEEPEGGDQAAAGSGIPDEAAKQITEDVCLLVGTVKLGVPPIQAPCSVQEAMEVECQGRANFIDPADGSAVARGEQFMDTYNECLFGNGSTYTQDAKACIKCREANKLISTDEAGNLNKDLDESTQQLKTDPDINQTIQELMEAKMEKRGLPQPPAEIAERVVELKEYYPNPPKVQQVGGNNAREGGEEPGENGSAREGGGKEANESGADANKEAGAEGAPQAAGRRLRRSLTKRQERRSQQIIRMQTAKFLCSQPASNSRFSGFLRPVQVRQRQRDAPRNNAPPTTLRTTVVQTRSVTKTVTATRAAPTQQTGSQLVVMSAFAFYTSRVVVQCQGRGVYVIAYTCSPPILMQNSALTPQKPLKQPSKKLAVFNQCSECSKKQVPVTQIINKPVAAVTSKCDSNVCNEVTKDVQKAVTSDKLEPLVRFAIFDQAPVQLDIQCTVCVEQGKVVPVFVPDNRRPVAQTAPAPGPQPQQQPQKQQPQQARPVTGPQRQGESCR
ncbi:hypothetical protein L249_1892 [Ophiocordyceps polyrhachis-furcata BCC 54312]|uniref:Uncharacterized protein n=1 Tax=Ophiocordyceps polyrhachis-furcata BCC 54312 TaxID=1330021 RepID=A0A367LNE0_9HYPO|nr:hypothetical protein L249_1892 [Ophiocordyceps polyrhachis-furcata BCC 54312]